MMGRVKVRQGLTANERKALSKASYWQARKDGETVERATVLAREAARAYQDFLREA